MDQFNTAEHVAAAYAPSVPVVLHRPHAAQRAAQWFVSEFPGTAYYAMKSNPEHVVLDALWSGGIRHFDVASLTEIRAIAQRFPSAEQAYMHPIKPIEVIREAYFEHGVRIFALDSADELTKIIAATQGAKDLTLCVRIAVDNQHAKIPLSRKFGVAGEEAVDLLYRTRLVAERLGVSFHVGSQTMVPEAYGAALTVAQRLVVTSGVFVDVVDIGGGFPAPYPGMEPPQLDAFARAIDPHFERFLSAENSDLWCEPGRALCAGSASLLVRVESRRGNDLYINDGTYGMLYDAGHLGWRYPVRVVGKASAPEVDFRFWGPTCDDSDMMPGPFHLPADIQAGDYLEIGMIGAYGRSMATRFNGFGEYLEVICTDDFCVPAHRSTAEIVPLESVAESP